MASPLTPVYAKNLNYQLSTCLPASKVLNDQLIYSFHQFRFALTTQFVLQVTPIFTKINNKAGNQSQLVPICLLKYEILTGLPQSYFSHTIQSWIKFTITKIPKIKFMSLGKRLMSSHLLMILKLNLLLSSCLHPMPTIPYTSAMRC